MPKRLAGRELLPEELRQESVLRRRKTTEEHKLKRAAAAEGEKKKKRTRHLAPKEHFVRAEKLIKRFRDQKKRRNSI